METVFVVLLVTGSCLISFNSLTCAKSLHGDALDVPQKVVNFSCIWQRLQYFHCQWSHPVEYNSSQIAVTFEWKKGYSGLYNKCSLVKDFTRCDDIPSINIISNTFRVNVTNVKSEIRSSTVIVVRYPREIYGKPDKMTELKAVVVSRTKVSLQWLSELGNLEYTITIKQNSSNEEIVYHYNSNSSELESVRIGHYHNRKTVVVEGLVLFTQYLFKVTARYCNFFDVTKPVGLPSDPTYATLNQYD